MVKVTVYTHMFRPNFEEISPLRSKRWENKSFTNFIFTDSFYDKTKTVTKDDGRLCHSRFVMIVILLLSLEFCVVRFYSLGFFFFFISVRPRISLARELHRFGYQKERHTSTKHICTWDWTQRAMMKRRGSMMQWKHIAYENDKSVNE